MWGATQSAGSLSDFMSACFPNTEQKLIDEIDTKIRAAAFEIDDSVLKAGGVHGNVVLVARDDDSAKIVEKDLNDFETDWKSSLENNEAKIIKQAKNDPLTREEKKWAIIVDNFTHALEKAKVVRDGRTVRLTFNEPLDPSDKTDLTDNAAKSADSSGPRSPTCSTRSPARSRCRSRRSRRSSVRRGRRISSPTRPSIRKVFRPIATRRSRRGARGKPAPVADPKCVRRPSRRRKISSASKTRSEKRLKVAVKYSYFFRRRLPPTKPASEQQREDHRHEARGDRRFCRPAWSNRMRS